MLPSDRFTEVSTFHLTPRLIDSRPAYDASSPAVVVYWTAAFSSASTEDKTSETKQGEARQASLAGPDGVSLRQISCGGPFARRAAMMALRTRRIPVTNVSTAPVILQHCAIDPLRGVDGMLAPGALSVGSVPSNPIGPAESAESTLTGTIPVRPGKYATTVRLLAASGDSLAIPVSLEVPSAAAWGILCMLLGLFLLGTVNLLQGEGAIRTTLHDALQARQDIHTVLENKSCSAEPGVRRRTDGS